MTPICVSYDEPLCILFNIIAIILIIALYIMDPFRPCKKCDQKLDK